MSSTIIIKVTFFTVGLRVSRNLSDTDTEPFIRGLEERPEVVEVGRGVAHDALGAVGARGMILITSDRLK